MTDAVQSKIRDLVQSDRVVLFMKGNRHFPQCGFSARVVSILDQLLPKYTTVNVLSDPAVREGVKVFSSWPTIPQLYVGGEFVGGCDIVTEMFESGELGELLGVKNDPLAPPKVTITEAAAKAFREAAESPEDLPRLSVGAGFQYDLVLDQKQSGDVVVEAGPIQILLDRASAAKVDGTTIDFVGGEAGGFKIDNPNEPPRVRSLRVEELRALMDRGEKLELIDVRTEEEWEIARIEGARLLDESGLRHLEGLDREARVVFYCHHGVRSRSAAERFLKEGFSRVFNLEGGIEAWSQRVDPKVPRY